jgi:hypothetical protein
VSPYTTWASTHIEAALDPDESSKPNDEDYPPEPLARRLRFIGPPELSMTNAWLKICFQRHPLCPKYQDVRLPTRVLDLQSEHKSHLKLVEANGTIGRYVCLSHCCKFIESISFVCPPLEIVFHTARFPCAV